MSINLVTYANQTVTPTNDAIIYERAIDQNGIFYGCNVTVTSNTVNITGGYGIVCGREFVINSESISVTLAPSGTLQGRLYVRLDLADADAPIQLLTATGNTLPPLEQDSDVNYTNGTYEMELATFTVGVSALSDVAETFETITGTKNHDKLIFFSNSPSMGNSPLLTEPITNFDVLDVYLVDNDGDMGFVSVPTSGNQFIATITKGSAGNSEVYIKSAMYYVQTGTNTLQYNSSGRNIQGYFSSNAQSVSGGAYIAIKAVVGRKFL